MAYKLKISEETDPLKIEKRRATNRKKFNDYAKKNKTANRLRIYRHKKKKKDFIDSFKVKCLKCGFSDKRALEFHHRNPIDKKFCISDYSHSRPFDVIEEEIRKCDILCSNCHQILEYELRKIKFDQ